MEKVEKETIINFNDEDALASIFTYNSAWQHHLEKKLKIKPIMSNGFGGREYMIEKKRIPMPRVPKKITAEVREQLVAQVARARQHRLLKKKALDNTNKNRATAAKKGG